MKRNSNFKSISFNNFEFISVFILLMFCAFISDIPKQILTACGSGSIIGVIILAVIAFIFYKLISKKVFATEYDFFEVMKKTYPPTILKIIGILLYIFMLSFVYVLINNILFNLKTTTYTLSTTFELGIFFLVGLFILVKKGFNSIFRISGYLSWVIVIYILIIFLLSIPFLSFNNFFPILGNGFKGVFTNNIDNITFFAPLFLTLLFGGSIVKYKRSNIKNYNKIFWFVAIALLLVIMMFIGAMPADLLSTRFALLFDISRIVSFTTTSVKIAPLMIFLFSIITFVASSFVFLTGCLSLEKTKVIKDYSKIIILSLTLLIIVFIIPQTLEFFYSYLRFFNIFSLGICFLLPFITMILYSIKFNNKKAKHFQEVNAHE